MPVMVRPYTGILIIKHSTMNELSKLIEYAYPYSPMAIKHGFTETGCWYVAIYPDLNAHFCGMPEPDSFTKDKVKAKEYADKLPYKYNVQQKHLNPGQ